MRQMSIRIHIKLKMRPIKFIKYSPGDLCHFGTSYIKISEAEEMETFGATFKRTIFTVLKIKHPFCIIRGGPDEAINLWYYQII